jgi:hypothetical protein
MSCGKNIGSLIAFPNQKSKLPKKYLGKIIQQFYRIYAGPVMKCLTAKLVTNILSYSSRLTNFVYYPTYLEFQNFQKNMQVVILEIHKGMYEK